MNNPLITIITAAFRLEGLEKVIECINNQTYKHWNHIIVNDNTPEISKKLDEICLDERRKCIDLKFRSHYFGGLTRNIGVILSFCYIREGSRDTENEFVCFLDDDNLWEEDHLQSMVDKLNEVPDATLIVTDALWRGVKDKTWTDYRSCRFFHGGCDLGQFLYKKELFDKYGYFNPRPSCKQRWDWELIEKMVDGETERIAFTNKATFLMSYRKH